MCSLLFLSQNTAAPTGDVMLHNNQIDLGFLEGLMLCIILPCALGASVQFESVTKCTVEE